MSIWLYTGTPGSGKSYHAARDIVHRLKRGGGLICNFPVNEDFVKKRKTHVEYWDNSELTAERLVTHERLKKRGTMPNPKYRMVIDQMNVTQKEAAAALYRVDRKSK